MNLLHDIITAWVIADLYVFNMINGKFVHQFIAVKLKGVYPGSRNEILTRTGNPPTNKPLLCLHKLLYAKTLTVIEADVNTIVE